MHHGVLVEPPQPLADALVTTLTGAVLGKGPFAAGPGLYVLDPEVRVIMRYAPGSTPSASWRI